MFKETRIANKISNVPGAPPWGNVASATPAPEGPTASGITLRTAPVSTVTTQTPVGVQLRRF